METKILWNGEIFNPTGWATVGREMCKALLDKDIKIQSSDFYHTGIDQISGYNDLDKLNKSIAPSQEDNSVLINCTYPQKWLGTPVKKRYAYLVHEGTVLPQGWTEMFNYSGHDGIIVLSNASKKLAKWNDINLPVTIIPAGINPDIFKPQENPDKQKDKFVFTFVNSWSGDLKDRKGFPLLLKAFTEEFKEEKDVILFAKLSTFWAPRFDATKAIDLIIGYHDDRIFWDDRAISKKELAKNYQNSDCLVCPTNGEAFGMTVLEAMACGLPVIVTKDKNSGYMDFTEEDVLYIETEGLEGGDQRFFNPQNRFPIVSLESLKKQMRYAYEHKDELKQKAIITSDRIRTDWTWQKSADKLLELINTD